MAERVLEIARREGILIHANAGLVDILSRLDVERAIPPELYRVVAEIIAFVFRVQAAAAARAAGVRFGTGVVVGAAWNSSSDNPENAAFLEAFEAKYDAAPDQFAAQAYAGLKLVDEAVRSGCSADREAVKEGLGQLENVPTVLGEFSLDENRDAVHPAVVQIVEGGKFTVLE